jgi:PAS domain S-box-containing protein
MQIMLLVVAVFLPALLALLFYLTVERQEARDVAFERVRNLAYNTAINLDMMLNNHDSVLSRMAQVVAVPGFDRVARSKVMSVGDAYLDPLTGRWVSVLSYPVQDAQGKTTSLVSLPVDLIQLSERLFGALPAGALVIVIDKSGKVIMRSREDIEFWAGKFFPPEMTQQVTGRAQGDFSTVGADGVQRLFSFAQVARADWRVVVGVPEGGVLAGSNAAFLSGAILVMGILALTLGFSWRISLGIVRPIDALNRVAAEVANGQTSSRVLLRTSPQELWSVALQFNHMLDAREGAQRELSMSEVRFRTLVALSSDWYWEQDGDYRFVRLDGKLQERTGIPIADFLGKTRWEQQILNLTQADWEQHRAVIDAHEEFRNFEIQRMNPMGQVRWAAVSGTPILDAHGQFCGYRGVGSDITERKRLEQDRLSLSLHIEDMSRRLVQTQEQIRRRFSRELHDRTSPNLAALRINLDIIAMASPAEHGTQDFADRVADTLALIEDTTISIREICAELHPPVLDIGGLLSVVQSYAQQFAKRTGLQVRINCSHGEVRLAPELELSLFRIVQEALTNCAKHANARVVEVRLQLDSNPLRLDVTDDGIGFDPDQHARARQVPGHGLLNMRETAEFAGGRFTVAFTPGSGTRVGVEI